MALNKGKAIKLHKFTIGTQVYTIRLRDVYDGLSTVVGISKIADNERPDNSEPTTVKEALQYGRLIKLRVGYIDGEKRKVASIYCVSGMLKKAMDDLPDKTIDSKQIKSAYQPTRRRLG